MKYFNIQTLVPQRVPILMVDELLDTDGEEAMVSLTVRPDNLFIAEDGRLEETGLIEHIAQSASAFAGYKAICKGATEPPVGYIAEVKKFRCHHRPQVGDELRTTITLGVEAGGVRLLTGKTCMEGSIVAETQMKIFIKDKH